MIDTQITIVARWLNLAILQSLEHCAARLIYMAAIAETAIVHPLAHFGEEMTEFLFFYIDNT